MKNEGERYLLNADGPFKGSRLFLDSDNLTDLNGLLNQVKKMKVMVVLLSKSYLTRPWCLAELYVAIKLGIKIVTVIIPEGD
ncbi:toll/interleukin-1 receptor domain-containing protein, partial [Salmonella enterica]|uniref:toll/interleukin-1 receptor domain-containing protein n=1 Tax=Salmonella enterica TaxID=28901 RepID=UPI0032993F53